MNENITPQEWLWRQIEQRLGPAETAALRKEYNVQLQIYQKRRKQENKAWEEERRRNPDPRILG